MNSVALYQALKAANVSDDMAARAAESVPQIDVTQIVTKDELRAAVAELRHEIASSQRNMTIWLIGAMVTIQGIFKLLP